MSELGVPIKAEVTPNDGTQAYGELDQGREEMGAGGSECASNRLLRPRSWWASGFTSVTAFRCPPARTASCATCPRRTPFLYAPGALSPDHRASAASVLCTVPVGRKRRCRASFCRSPAVALRSFPNQLWVHLLHLAPCASVSVSPNLLD